MLLVGVLYNCAQLLCMGFQGIQKRFGLYWVSKAVRCTKMSRQLIIFTWLSHATKPFCPVWSPVVAETLVPVHKKDSQQYSCQHPICEFDNKVVDYSNTVERHQTTVPIVRISRSRVNTAPRLDHTKGMAHSQSMTDIVSHPQCVAWKATLML